MLSVGFLAQEGWREAPQRELQPRRSFQQIEIEPFPLLPGGISDERFMIILVLNIDRMRGRDYWPGRGFLVASSGAEFRGLSDLPVDARFGIEPAGKEVSNELFRRYWLMAKAIITIGGNSR